MSDLIYENIIEAIRSQVPNHVLINCLDHDGFAVRTQNYKSVLMQDGSIGILNGISMRYYRGERRIHDRCIPTLYRIKSIEDRVVALLKSYDFQLFLDTTDEVKAWRDGNNRLDLWALCQHYEFDTPMLDVTTEIAVAAFFATHKFDWRINKYILQETGIGQIIVYFSVAPEMDNSGIKLIGLQPFSRPGNQDGAGLWLPEGDDMISRGSVLRFKQNADVNNRLERALAQGADIYMPYEPITRMAHLIKNTKVVTNSSIALFLKDAYNWLKDCPDEKDVRKILNQKGIAVVDAPLVDGSMMNGMGAPVINTARAIVKRPILGRD